MEKIDTFLGKDRGVNADLVRELVPLSRSGVIFELGNALAARDLRRSPSRCDARSMKAKAPIGILPFASFRRSGIRCWPRI